MTPGVYIIENSISGKNYVGSAVRPRDRWSIHKHNLRRGTHHSGKLQRAWDKYGAESFSFRLLLLCSKENLTLYEQRALDTFKAASDGYNVLPLARSSLGHKLSPEQRARLRLPRGPMLSLVGHIVSAETRAKIGAGNKGKVRTEEARKRMSIAQKNRVSHTSGWKHTEEAKARMSALSLGRKRAPESIAKGVLNNAGFRHTEESKEKMRMSAKDRKPVSDESRERMRIAHQKRRHKDAVV